MTKKSALFEKKTDKSLLILVLSFLAFGLMFIANATSVSSSRIYGSPYRFVLLQSAWILLSLVVFVVFSKINYRKLKKFSYILFGINTFFLFILAIVSIFPCSSGFSFAPCINGANRWLFLNPSPLPQIPFLGVLGFQPGEMAKLSLILFLSFKLTEDIKKKFSPFYVYLVITGFVSGLVLMQPNMSTAALIFILGTIIYFVSGGDLKPLFVLFPIIIGLGSGAVLLSPYRRERLLTLINGSGNESLSAGYHIQQILIALGSGGIFGVGFGQSKQKYAYLPEIASDSIFAIIGEEFGFIGTTLVIIAFSFLIYKCFTISKNAPDLLGKLIGVGITSWIGIQFFVNVAAMTKIIPLTGVPIPLISYGGSSMLFSLMGMGILANISKNS